MATSFTAKQRKDIARKIRVCDFINANRAAFTYRGLDYTAQVVKRGTDIICIQAA